MKPMAAEIERQRADCADLLAGLRALAEHCAQEIGLPLAECVSGPIGHANALLASKTAASAAEVGHLPPTVRRERLRQDRGDLLMGLHQLAEYAAREVDVPLAECRGGAIGAARALLAAKIESRTPAALSK